MKNRLPVLIALVACLSSSMAAGAEETWDLKHGVVWYSSAPDEATIERAARRYTIGITGKGERGDPQRIRMKQLNPRFRWFVYNSGTDNYVESAHGTPEHDLLETVARARGWDAEEAYLHYGDDTTLVLQGDTLLIPGWEGGRARSPAEARIPVYSKDLSRRLVNFSTARAAQLHREVMVRLAFDTPFSGSRVYADGVFLDNAAFHLYNFGRILEGGHVLEAPGRPVLGSPEYQDWHWRRNFGPFLTALKDTLETSAAWAADGQRKALMLNVANVWDDSYVSGDVADILFMEFQYNPVRNAGLQAVEEAYRRNRLAGAAGIATFHAAGMTRQLSGRPGSFSYAEILLGNLVWYLVARVPGSIFFEMGTNTPMTAGWDTLTWRGCIDVAGEQLGRPLSAPYTIAEGTDGVGNPYAVKARKYERGLAILRNRGAWEQGIEPETAVAVELPGPMARVDPLGRIGEVVEVVRLRNGEAALLLGDPGEP